MSNPPSDEKIRRLEQSLGFVAGDLLGQAHLQRTPSDVRAMLAKLAQGKGEIEAELHRMMGKEGNGAHMVVGNAVPIIDDASAGHVGCPGIEDANAFAARVAGDAMMPRYREGDVVIFAPSLSARSGDDCFVRFDDGQTTFKRVFMETDEMGQAVMRLQPRNEKYRAQIVQAKRVAGIFRAVYRYERIDGEV